MTTLALIKRFLIVLELSVDKRVNETPPMQTKECAFLFRIRIYMGA